MRGALALRNGLPLRRRQERWDSLTLFTSRPYDSLPGLDFPGDTAGYPNRDEVIEYLEEYAPASSCP